jgi:hypothetical protein
MDQQQISHIYPGPELIVRGKISEIVYNLLCVMQFNI